MPAPNPQDAFLLDLSLAYAGGRTVLEVLEQAVEEIADVRARALLARCAEEARAQLQAVERIFSLLAAGPQEPSCPAMDSVRQELSHFRQQDPAPELLTAMTLLASLKIEHDEVATYGLLVDKAVLLGQLEAAQILTIIARQGGSNLVEMGLSQADGGAAGECPGNDDRVVVEGAHRCGVNVHAPRRAQDRGRRLNGREPRICQMS